MGEQTGIVIKSGALGQKRAINDVSDVGLCLHPTDHRPERARGSTLLLIRCSYGGRSGGYLAL
jgi:hypothetical protein